MPSSAALQLLPTGEEGPAEYPTGGSRNADAYAQWVRALWDEQEEEMRPFHDVWVQNLLFLAGRQWWTYDGQGGIRFHEPGKTLPAWRQTPVTNLVLPFLKTFLAKATRPRPAWQIVSASSEPKDTHAAELADAVLRSKWIELQLGRLWRTAIVWRILTGNVYILPYWNTRTGRYRVAEAPMEVPVWEDGIQVGTEVLTVPLDGEGDPILGEDGRPKPGAKPTTYDEGEIAFKAYSPFQVRVDPDATTLEDAEWYIIGVPRTLRALVRDYPQHKGKFSAESVEEVEWADSTLSAVLAGEQITTSPRDRRGEHLSKAMERHYYERPSERYPRGRYWCTAGGCVVVKPQPLPSWMKWPGLIHLRDVEIPGRLLAMSTLEQVVDINRRYNEKTGKIEEYDAMFLQGKWLVPRQSGIRKGMITRAPGEVIPYNGTHKPEMMNMVPLPQQVYAERQQALMDFEQVSGIRRVSQGGAPTGVTAGIALQALQEADDQDLGPFMEEGDEGIAAMAAAGLRMIKANYTEERLYYAAGPSKSFTVKAFSASELEGAIDVVPQTTSSRAWNETMRQAILMELAQKLPQIFTDEETGQFDKGKFAKALPSLGVEAAYETEDVDVAEALREQDVFSEFTADDDPSLLPQVQPWQNHRAHLNTHRRMMVSGEWDEWTPEARAALTQHYLDTEAYIQQTRMERAMEEQGIPPEAAAAMQGGPLDEALAGVSPEEMAMLAAEEDAMGMDAEMGEMPIPL